MSAVVAIGLLLDAVTVLTNGLTQAAAFQQAIAKAQAEGRTDLTPEIEAFRASASDSLNALDTVLGTPIVGQTMIRGG